MANIIDVPCVHTGALKLSCLLIVLDLRLNSGLPPV